MVGFFVIINFQPITLTSQSALTAHSLHLMDTAIFSITSKMQIHISKTLHRLTFVSEMLIQDNFVSNLADKRTTTYYIYMPQKNL